MTTSCATCETTSEPRTRTFAYQHLHLADAEIDALVYVTDYRAEEEYGTRDLRIAVTSDDKRRFKMTRKARANIRAFSDVNALMLSTKPLPDGDPTWGQTPAPPWDGGGWQTRDAGNGDYPGHFSRNVIWARGLPDPWRMSRKKMDELRADARTLGISPLPRRKDDLVGAICAHPDSLATADTPDCWPGWFHHGDLLVLRADDGATADALARIVDAYKAGTLGIGDGSGVFSTGLTIYDTRQETKRLVREREAAFDWHDTQMSKVADVHQRLKDRYTVYFLGRPTERDWDKTGERSVKYWLNISRPYGKPTPTTPHGQLGKQVMGYYSVAELADETFVADSVAKAS